MRDLRTDPNVPLIPPHATFEQVKDPAAALLTGDPGRRGVIKEGVLTKAREILPIRVTGQGASHHEGLTGSYHAALIPARLLHGAFLSGDLPGFEGRGGRAVRIDHCRGWPR